MHLLSALIFLAGCTPLSRAVPKEDWPEYTDSAQFQSAIVEQSNIWRTWHQVPNFVWNTTLAEFAENVVAPCLLQHSVREYYGENLATNYRTPSEAVYGWGDESVGYDYNTTLFASGTSHFTQLVWKDSTDIGCATKFCGNGENNPGGGLAWGWLIACEFYPQGNIETQFLDNVFPPTS